MSKNQSARQETTIQGRMRSTIKKNMCIRGQLKIILKIQWTLVANFKELTHLIVTITIFVLSYSNYMIYIQRKYYRYYDLNLI